jgi:hypothetical protein
MSLLTMSIEGSDAHNVPLTPRFAPARLVRRNALVEQNDPVRPRRCEHSLFSVMGQKFTGRAIAGKCGSREMIV